MMYSAQLIAAAAGLVLVLTACGGSSDDTAPAPGEPGAEPLTSEQFDQLLGEKICQEYESCNPGYNCNPDAEVDDLPASCDFDPVQAQNCLDGDLLCDDRNPDQPFVELPLGCHQVYDCS